MARCPRKLLAVAAAIPLALVAACGSGPAPAAAADGLEAAIITASLITAGGCAWCLGRRLEEYRG